jgi:hypothetical protein
MSDTECVPCRLNDDACCMHGHRPLDDDDTCARGRGDAYEAAQARGERLARAMNADGSLKRGAPRKTIARPPAHP